MNAGEITVTSLTHRGAVRAANEDAIIVGPAVACASMTSPAICTLPMDGPVVVAVADGIGGQVAGEIASEHVARRLAETGGRLTTQERVRELLRVLDLEVQDHAGQHPEFSGMGTTIAGLVLTPEGEHVWFNVGDSRVYRCERAGLVQVSVDDSPPVPPSPDGRPVASNFITQSLGGRSSGEITPHVGQEPGTVWLVCTDGLTDLVGEGDMERTLAEAGSDEAAVYALWQAAMAAGGKDNISIVLARM